MDSSEQKPKFSQENTNNVLKSNAPQEAEVFIPFSGSINNLNEKKEFWVVLVDGAKHPPQFKHDSYKKVYEEMLRLSAKEKANAYVLKVVSQVEMLPTVTNF